MKKMIFSEKLKKEYDFLQKSSKKYDLLFYEFNHEDEEGFHYNAYFLRDKDFSKEAKEYVSKNKTILFNEAKNSELESVNLEEITEEARNKRNKLLIETDYLMMPDYPISEEQLSLLKKYRKKLREVPEQEGFPQNIIWPKKP